jgi:hypothetical protein
MMITGEKNKAKIQQTTFSRHNITVDYNYSCHWLIDKGPQVAIKVAVINETKVDNTICIHCTK